MVFFSFRIEQMILSKDCHILQFSPIQIWSRIHCRLNLLNITTCSNSEIGPKHTILWGAYPKQIEMPTCRVYVSTFSSNPLTSPFQWNMPSITTDAKDAHLLWHLNVSRSGYFRSHVCHGIELSTCCTCLKLMMKLTNIFNLKNNW